MVVDAHAAEPNSILTADVCIVGAGAAGLTLATSLAGTPLRVIVLEGGGGRIEDHSQRMYRGVTTGQPYYELDACRIRALGGTTNTWGGWCRPLDPIDFRERVWLPHSGWPFDREALSPFYQRAHAICQLGRFDYDPHHFRTASHSLLPEHSHELCETIFHIGPTRFAEQYLDVLRRASNVRLFLHSTAVELQLDPDRDRVVSLSAAGATTRFTVQASTFVIAAGGIENARLLLASRSEQPSGIGNTHDLVGRFFADHLHVPIGHLEPRHRRHRFRPVQRANGTTVRGAAVLNEAGQAHDRLPGFALTFHDEDDPHDVLSPGRMPPAYESLATLVRAARSGERPQRTLHHLATIATGLNTAAMLASKKVWKPPPRRVPPGTGAKSGEPGHAGRSPRRLRRTALAAGVAAQPDRSRQHRPRRGALPPRAGRRGVALRALRAGRWLMDRTHAARRASHGDDADARGLEKRRRRREQPRARRPQPVRRRQLGVSNQRLGAADAHHHRADTAPVGLPQTATRFWCAGLRSCENAC
jgi:hypothetical protein